MEAVRMSQGGRLVSAQYQARHIGGYDGAQDNDFNPGLDGTAQSPLRIESPAGSDGASIVFSETLNQGNSSPIGSEELPESEPEPTPVPAAGVQNALSDEDWAGIPMPMGGMPIGIGCVVREVNGEFFVGTLMGLMTDGNGAVSAVRWALPGMFAVAQDNFFRRRCGVLICHPWDFVHPPTFFKPQDWTYSGFKLGCCAGCPPGAGNPLRCDMCIYIMLNHKRQAYDRGLLPMPTV
jgi:hypothetical protein